MDIMSDTGDATKEPLRIYFVQATRLGIPNGNSANWGPFCKQHKIIKKSADLRSQSFYPEGALLYVLVKTLFSAIRFSHLSDRVFSFACYFHNFYPYQHSAHAIFYLSLNTFFEI